MKKNYNAVDLAKFIFSILIVSMHTLPFLDFSNNANFIFENIISRLGVPFFFIVSGYFLIASIKDSHNEKAVFKKHLLKIVRLYILWSLIYFPWDLYIIYKVKKNWLQSVCIYIYNFFIIGSHNQLWFLLALIIVIIITWILKKRLKTLFVFSLILYLIGVFGDSYYGISQISKLNNFYNVYFNFFKTTRNGLFFGLIYFIFGILIFNNEKKENTGNIKRNLLISIVLFFSENFILRLKNIPKDYNMTLFLLPISYYFFIYIKNFEITNSKNYIKLREYSLIIYCFHWIPKIIYENLIFTKIQSHFIEFIFCSGISIIFAFLIGNLDIKYKKFFL